MGGAEKTFACKSQECLWQDWYIYALVMGNSIAVTRVFSQRQRAFKKRFLQVNCFEIN